MSATSSTRTSTVQTIDDKKKAEIGVKGFYHVDNRTFVAKTERAMKASEKKGWVYDRDYGLVGLTQEGIDAFIEHNELEPLAPGTLEAAPPTSATSTATSGAPARSGNGPKCAIGGSATSPSALAAISERLARLPADKFLNISTMREVKSQKKELVYNVSSRLAARQEDKSFLDDVVCALGGSPTGSPGAAPAPGSRAASSPGASAASSSSGATAPAPSARRITTGMNEFQRKIYGTPEALTEFSKLSLGGSSSSVVLAPSAPIPGTTPPAPGAPNAGLRLDMIARTNNKLGMRLPLAPKKPVTAMVAL